MKVKFCANKTSRKNNDNALTQCPATLKYEEGRTLGLHIIGMRDNFPHIRVCEDI
jgi:hypothetical protein